MSKCPHGMPSKGSCVDCMNDEGLGGEPKPPVTVEFEMVARYDGHCDECNLPIHVGQVIAKLSNDRYVHQACPRLRPWRRVVDGE